MCLRASEQASERERERAREAAYGSRGAPGLPAPSAACSALRLPPPHQSLPLSPAPFLLLFLFL
eukprot:3088391-Rhodomonas_salina.1